MELKAKRPFYGKVRTGCLTCKQRKIKCDERKPQCHRCVSTGRQCQGYRPPPTRASFNRCATPRPLITHSRLFGSAPERRSFYYFQARASEALGGYFNASFFSISVMQAAIHYEPIRHLVIALGAAYESFEARGRIRESLPPLSTNQSRAEEDTATQVALMAFALQQSNHCIKQLTELSVHSPCCDSSVETTSCVLTASVLFIYLACVRNQLAEAIQHIRSAIRVLRDFDEARSASVDSSHQHSSPVFPVSITQLRALLIGAYGQIRVLSNDVFLQDRALCSRDMLVSDVEMATLFLSVPEAHSYVQRLFHNVQAFLQETELSPPSSNDAENLHTVVSRHKRLCQALESSWNALEKLSSSLDSLSPGGTESGQQTDKDGVVVLRLYHLLLSIRLRIDIFRPEERESSFDELEVHFAEMLKCCEVLVEGQARQRAVEIVPPVCSSGLGYIMPLHTIAARCRKPALRNRALQLLLKSSRRDGIWDSNLAGTIASLTLELEKGADEISPRGEERIREVKIRLHEQKGAQLNFVTVRDWKNGHAGYESILEW